MNEVEPWGSRVRRVVGDRSTRAGRLLERAWAWFTDLGQGAWLLALGVAIVAAIGIGVFEGRHGAEPSACSDALKAEQQIVHADGHRLDAARVTLLHRDAKLLNTVAPKALGAGPGALTYAAQMAGAAHVGVPFDAGVSGGKYQSACGTYP